MSDPMSELDAWIALLCRETGVDPALVDRDAVLDLAGDAAHAVLRPAAPVTTFVAGVLVGRSLETPDLAAVLDRVRALLPEISDGDEK